jgi:hypothetical protein
MENTIEKRLIDLKISFTKIVDTKNEDLSTFATLEIRMNKLKDMYAEFVNNNKGNLFVFGLDSFRFQGKLIDIEYSDMKRLFLAITNRMYCEYFKLFKIIIEYIKENCDDKKLQDFIKVNDNYPIYKDLEPFKQYDFEIIQNLHELLITILTSLNSILINKEYDLKVYQSKNNIGLNIDNFVNTLNFNNIMMREKIILFITYLEFFHKLHNKYFKRFTTKLQLMYGQITHDIKFDDNEEAKKSKNQDMLHTLEDEEVGKKILKELRASINDNTESETGSEFELFDKLGTPKSISMDYEDNHRVKSGSQDSIEEHPEILVENANIRIEVTETLEQMQKSLETLEETEKVAENEVVAEVYKTVFVEENIVVQENETREEEKSVVVVDLPEIANETIAITKTLSNDDELSVVTMESTSGGSNENNSNNSENTSQMGEKKEEVAAPEKKKRTYKPRKKKETPPSN